MLWDCEKFADLVSDKANCLTRMIQPQEELCCSLPL